MEPHAYKTYQIVAPASTHWREATCAEVECEAYAWGWDTVVDASTDLGARQAKYITGKSGRAYYESRDGSMVTYTFTPGQTCFATHRLPLEREPIYLVRGGDVRRYTSRTQRNGDDWLEDFAEHQDMLHTEIERG